MWFSGISPTTYLPRFQFVASLPSLTNQPAGRGPALGVAQGAPGDPRHLGAVALRQAGRGQEHPPGAPGATSARERPKARVRPGGKWGLKDSWSLKSWRFAVSPGRATQRRLVLRRCSHPREVKLSNSPSLRFKRHLSVICGRKMALNQQLRKQSTKIERPWSGRPLPRGPRPHH